MSESFDVRIITASYRREPVDGPEEPQEPVIQLFGRTREGKSIAIEYSGFKPEVVRVNVKNSAVRRVQIVLSIAGVSESVQVDAGESRARHRIIRPCKQGVHHELVPVGWEQILGNVDAHGKHCYLGGPPGS